MGRSLQSELTRGPHTQTLCIAWYIGSILKRAFLRALRASRVQLLVVRPLKPRISASSPIGQRSRSSSEKIIGTRGERNLLLLDDCFCNIILHLCTLTSWNPSRKDKLLRRGRSGAERSQRQRRCELPPNAFPRLDLQFSWPSELLERLP